jgi:hypothetical protein
VSGAAGQYEPPSCENLQHATQVQVHPDDLIRYGLSLDDVVTASRRATGVRGAGFIDTTNQRIVFQTEGQSIKPDDIARTVLLSQGAASVTLGNVADVIEAPEPPIGAGAVQGKPGVVLNVSEQYHANTVEVTKAVEAALRELQPSLRAEGLTLDPDVFRPANFIASATGNVRESLILGGILVIVGCSSSSSINNQQRPTVESTVIIRAVLLHHAQQRGEQPLFGCRDAPRLADVAHSPSSLCEPSRTSSRLVSSGLRQIRIRSGLMARTNERPIFVA